MLEELKEIMGGLDRMQKVGQQRAVILAALVATLRNSHKFETIDELKEFLALRTLSMLQECPVGDYIDGKSVVELTELIPDGLERMSPETRTSFQRLKDLIETKEDEMEMDDLINDLDIPRE